MLVENKQKSSAKEACPMVQESDKTSPSRKEGVRFRSCWLSAAMFSSICSVLHSLGSLQNSGLLNASSFNGRSNLYKSTLMSEDWSRESVLGIMTRLWVGGSGFYFRQTFSLPQNFHICCGDHLDFFSMGKAARA